MTGTRKIHVLIVDDDPLTRLMASEALRESGYTSVEAEDGCGGGHRGAVGGDHFLQTL